MWVRIPLGAHLGALWQDLYASPDMRVRVLSVVNATLPICTIRSPRDRALALSGNGLTLQATSEITGVPWATLRDWCAPRRLPRLPSYRTRCAREPRLPEPQWHYAYLLGLYLGDGCISVSGDPAEDV